MNLGPGIRRLAWPMALATAASLLAAPPAPAQPPPGNVNHKFTGFWNSRSSNWDSEPTVHMVLTRGRSSATSGRFNVLFYYGGANTKVWQAMAGDTITAGSNITLNLPPNETNLFCSGHSHLPDGTVLVTGGSETSSEGVGIASCFTFNPQTLTWATPPQMQQNRWYPTNTSLKDGSVLTLGGYRFFEMLTWGGRDSTGANAVKNDIHSDLGLRGPVEVNSYTAVSDTLPGARQAHGGVFCNVTGSIISFSATQRMVIYGGRNSSGGVLSDIWSLTRDGNSNWAWSQEFPDAWTGPSSPGGRYGHSMVYDDSAKAVWIYGGVDGSGTELRDLWKLELRTATAGTRDKWKRIWDGTGAGIPALQGHTAIVQNRGGSKPRRLIVFGGADDAGVYQNKVWAVDLTPSLGSGSVTWNDLTPGGSCGAGTAPCPRARHLAVYDYEDHDHHGPTADEVRMVVFGGDDGTQLFGDLWTLSLPNTGALSWTKITPSGAAPSARTEAGGVNDDELDRFVLVGGDGSLSSGGELSDVWTIPLDGATFVWTKRKGNLPGKARAGFSVAYDNRWQVARLPEKFTSTGFGSWTGLTSGDNAEVQTYPFTFMTPSGNVAWIGPNNLNRLFSTTSNTWSTPSWGGVTTSGGSAAMYTPGKLMKCGSFNSPGQKFTSYLELNGSDAGTWVNADTTTTELLKRARLNLTILPNGKLLATGGLEDEHDIDTAVRRPQVWDPATHDWEAHDPLWALEPAARDYHSTALLLPDGRILSAGGFGDHGTEENPDRDKATIFWPPYLFDQTSGATGLATRPVITALDTLVTWCGTFAVVLADTTNITKVSLMKPGAVTHGFNQDQRYMEASFTSTVSGSTRRLVVTVPSSSSEAPPGDYMVFVHSANGTPSVAAWLRITPGEVHSGTASASATWNSGELHFLSGTYIVPTGITLTIESGVSVVVADGASLRVDGGTLTATGAVFTGQACAAERWTGITVGSGVGTLTSCKIRDAAVGLTYGVLGASNGTGSADQCTVEDFGVVGIHVNSLSGTSVILDRNTVNCPAIANIVGIQVNASNATPPGIYRSRINGPGSSVSGAKGIYCVQSASLLGNRIKDFNGTSGRGIEFALSDSTAVPVVDRYTGSLSDTTVISNCKDGIYVTNFSRPRIRKARIDNTTYAIRVTSAAYADVGKYGDEGNCDISNSSTKFVHAATRLPGFPNIDALYNYWGTTSSSTIAAKMTANVNWDPFLTSDPLPTLEADRWGLVAINGEDRPRVFQAAPNPFQTGTVISYFVPRDGVAVALKVFNVHGELVATRTDIGATQGRQEWAWDGKDRNGREVPAGAYYVSIHIGRDFHQTRRMIRVR